MQITKENVEQHLGEYLESIRKAEKIEMSITELRYKLIPSGIDNSKTKVMSSYQDRTSAIIAEIEQLQNLLDMEKQKSEKLKKRTYAEIIKAIPDKKIYYRKVLVLRYLHGKNISDIANTLGYTDRHILRMKKFALDHIVEIYSKATEEG